MCDLPREATTIDPSLREVGAARTHQRLVFGEVDRTQAQALLVVQLLEQHPAGIVGRFYGTRLSGLLLDDGFRPWASEPLGEVCWDNSMRRWVQAQAVPA